MVINGIRLGLLTSLVCKVSVRGMSAARCRGGKLSSASIKRSVSRTDTS